MNGYHNRMAWIDLGKRKAEIRSIDEKDRDLFAGCASLGAVYLARLVDGKTDPLGPENPLIFMTGPFAASGVPASSRHNVISLSPLTGIYGESNSGGSFGWQLKRTGFDGIPSTPREAANSVRMARYLPRIVEY